MENMTVTLDRADVSQLLDACKIRQAEWEKKAQLTRSQFGAPEAREEERIAEHYADIITKLETAIPSTAAILVPMSEDDYDELEDDVTIIASGYEFDCPDCDSFNTLIDIPKYQTAVECHNCHEKFRIDNSEEGVLHAHS